MKLFVIIIVFSLLSMPICAQKILLLEKPGTINNIKFRIGDRIEFSTIENLKNLGIISHIGDSTITVNYLKVKINEIKYIYKRLLFPSIMNGVGIQGGIAYVGIDIINNLINDESPYIKKSTLKTTGYTIGIGIIAKFFSKNKRKIDGKNWRLTILDFD